MSRLIDPREQRAGRRFVPPEPSEHPPLSAAAMWRDELRHDREPEQDRRRHSYQPKPSRRPLPTGAVQVIVRSPRGVLHRGYTLDGGPPQTHARCNVVPAETLPNGAEYWFDNLSRPGFFCRYPWCFRDLLDEMGVDTFTGHVSRKLPKRRITAVPA